MRTIILPIKPIYVKLIFEGKKTVEYRRWKPKCILPFKVILYSSGSGGKIEGEFTVNSILEEEIETLWDITKRLGGISKQTFLNYFKGKKVGQAFVISDLTIYPEPKKLSEFGLTKAPQRFAYYS